MGSENTDPIFTFSLESFNKCKWPGVTLDWSCSRQLADRQKWLYDNIPPKHVMWYIDETTATYKFRFEKDLVWFRLSWS